MNSQTKNPKRNDTIDRANLCILEFYWNLAQKAIKNLHFLLRAKPGYPDMVSYFKAAFKVQNPYKGIYSL